MVEAFLLAFPKDARSCSHRFVFFIVSSLTGFNQDSVIHVGFFSLSLGASRIFDSAGTCTRGQSFNVLEKNRARTEAHQPLQSRC